MELYLSSLTPDDAGEFQSFYEEFMAAGGRIHPGVLRKYRGDFAEYLAYIEKLADAGSAPPGFAASDTYVLKDGGGRIYGMSVLRHALTGGGHIGYGIRPSERGKGCGTRQLALLLEKCRALGIGRVLVTCDRDNPASAKVARNNGGVLADEIVEEDGNILQRYWIALPQIRAVTADMLPDCLRVIRAAFATVAAEFGLTRANCPTHTSFLKLETLQAQLQRGRRMAALFAGEEIVGFMALSDEGGGAFELHNLAVAPGCRHQGYGRLLLEHAKETVCRSGGRSIKIGILDENACLKEWYRKNGFTSTGAQRFAHLPFTVGFMEWSAEAGAI